MHNTQFHYGSCKYCKILISEMLLKHTLVLVEVLFIATAVCGIPLANFSRFGNDTGDSFLLSGDDENARISVSPSLLFFNATHTHIYVRYKQYMYYVTCTKVLMYYYALLLNFR